MEPSKLVPRWRNVRDDMKLDFNPDAPLNLAWVNQLCSLGHSALSPMQKDLFSEFKRYWQLSLDLNQSFEARHVHYVLAEKYAREIFDTALRYVKL